MVKVFVKTYGCAANQARGEKLVSLLRGADHEICGSTDEAKVVVLNTCSLKTPTEVALFRFLRENEGKAVIVAGCFPLSFPDDERLKDVSVVGTYDFNKIAEAVESVLEGERVVFLSRDKSFLDCSPERENKLIAKVEIGSGCLGNCAYCAGKLAHGALKSKPVDEVLGEVKRAVEDGCKEVWLCSQDTGCYGFDIGEDIVGLLKRVVEIEGEFFVRIGMMNPEWVLRLLDGLTEIYRHPKIYKFLHVPVQSGDDGILKAMFRRYDVGEFVRVVESFRKSILNMSIATDVIVGLPGETEKSFRKTVDLIRKVRPEVLNISRYWARRGTVAGAMESLHPKYSKEFSRKLDRLFNELAVEVNRKWIGKEVDVLFTGRGAKTGQYRGRNISYKPILVASFDDLLGSVRRVRIVEVSKDHLLGELI